MLSTEPENGLFPATFLPGEGYIYLVQYMDGNRIDFQFRVLNHLETYLKEDSLTKIILDKDKRVKGHIIPDDSSHWIKKPTPEMFQASIEEFWWQILNTLKALAREELTVAFFYLTISREEVMRLLTWKIALTDGFDRNYGKQYHRIINRLDAQERKILEAIYCGLAVIEMIKALKNMNKLAESVITGIGKQLSYSYEEFKEVPYLYLKVQKQIELLELTEE